MFRQIFFLAFNDSVSFVCTEWLHWKLPVRSDIIWVHLGCVYDFSCVRISFNMAEVRYSPAVALWLDLLGPWCFPVVAVMLTGVCWYKFGPIMHLSTLNVPENFGLDWPCPSISFLISKPILYQPEKMLFASFLLHILEWDHRFQVNPHMLLVWGDL